MTLASVAVGTLSALIYVIGVACGWRAGRAHGYRAGWADGHVAGWDDGATAARTGAVDSIVAQLAAQGITLHVQEPVAPEVGPALTVLKGGLS